MIDSLFANFSQIAFVLVGWLFAKQFLARSRRRTRTYLLGLMGGVVTMLAMATAQPIVPGVIFDLRFALIASLTLIEGPLVGMIAAGLAAGFRLYLGGSGALAGTIAILGVLAVSALGHHLSGRNQSALRNALHTLSFAATAATLPFFAVFLLPGDARQMIAAQLIGLDILLNFSAILILTWVVGLFRQKVRENTLLLEALDQATDCIYIKDRQGRYAAVNAKVIQRHGLAKKSDVLGKTVFDLDPKRAPDLFAEDQRLVRGELEVLQKFETHASLSGEMRILDTIKTLLKDADGEAVGLIGITRDVTEQSQIKQELAENQELLSLVLATMADGVAMFDEQARLVFCNPQYHNFFSLTRRIRVPGAKLQDILKQAAEREEQKGIPKDNVDGWIQSVVASVMQGGKQEVQLFDGRTIEVRSTPVKGRGAVSVVSDITQIRAAETQLAGLASRLQILATTDALTAVMNRRAFDKRFERDMVQARQTGMPLSLLILDIDNFKAFNDFYGHLEGDECLKKVASIMAATLVLPEQSLARYGGEEFCLILPATGEDDALAFAERVRCTIENSKISHEASEKGFVTVSVGVSTFTSDQAASMANKTLKERADAALYQAKRSGRNRVCAGQTMVKNKTAASN